MLGGLKLLVGDQLIDGSIATQLNSMREDLRHGGSNTIPGHLSDFLGQSNEES